MEAKAFGKRTVKANSVMFTEGEPGDTAFLIIQGKVEIRKGAMSEVPKVVAVLEDGDIVGEMALFDDRPRMATAVSATDIEVIPISREEFKKRLKEMNPVMRRILMIMVSRVRSMTDEFMRKKGETKWNEQLRVEGKPASPANGATAAAPAKPAAPAPAKTA